MPGDTSEPKFSPSRVESAQETPENLRKQFDEAMQGVTDRKKAPGKADLIMDSVRGRFKELMENMPSGQVALDEWKAKNEKEFDILHGILRDWEDVGRVK